MPSVESAIYCSSAYDRRARAGGDARLLWHNVLANEPATMNGTSACWRAGTILSRRSRRSLIDWCLARRVMPAPRPRRAAGPASVRPRTNTRVFVGARLRLIFAWRLRSARRRHGDDLPHRGVEPRPLAPTAPKSWCHSPWFASMWRSGPAQRRSDAMAPIVPESSPTASKRRQR